MNNGMKVEFSRHNIGMEEKEAVFACLDSIFLTTGSVVSQFEKEFARYLNLKYAVGLNSCTAALHLALLALGIKKGDEIITTPLTFIATPNAILYTGAKPVFVDVEKGTGLLDHNKIAKAITKKTKAILPVHLYGQMCDMKAIKKICGKKKISIIEDAAHCIEGRRDGVAPGELGDIACFSFYATKNITCGEGGAIATNREDLADQIKCLRTHGMSKSAADRYVGRYQHWDMEALGWKYNMSNIDASLLLNQLQKIEHFLKRREEICSQYEQAFRSHPGIKLLDIYRQSRSARHLFTILVDPKKRDEILWKLQEKNIGVAVNYRALHLLSYYRSEFGFKRGMFPMAEYVGDATISLPLYPKLDNREVEYVIKSVKEAVKS